MRNVIWAGRFSRMLPFDSKQNYVTHVARSIPGVTGRQTGEERKKIHPGDFNSAVAHCRELVDRFLAGIFHEDMTPEELFSRYRRTGPDPYICYEESGDPENREPGEPVPFNAWGYAETACRRLCGEEPGEPSRSLSLWQGRYREYDRIRMTSQLLLGRKVRVSGECAAIPAGAVGIAGMHACFVDVSCFDWSLELPVIFTVADERGHITLGIPLSALEFVESDDDYICGVKTVT